MDKTTTATATTATVEATDNKVVGTAKGVRLATYELINEGKYTKSQIIDLICKEWQAVKAITVSTYLSDAKNPKYSKALKLAVEDAKTKIFSFGETPINTGK